MKANDRETGLTKKTNGTVRITNVERILISMCNKANRVAKRALESVKRITAYVYR